MISSRQETPKRTPDSPVASLLRASRQGIARVTHALGLVLGKLAILIALVSFCGVPGPEESQLQLSTNSVEWVCNSEEKVSLRGRSTIIWRIPADILISSTLSRPAGTSSRPDRLLVARTHLFFDQAPPLLL